jgi:hypothetical protein
MTKAGLAFDLKEKPKLIMPISKKITTGTIVPLAGNRREL